MLEECNAIVCKYPTPPKKKPQTNKQNKAKQNKTIVSRKHVQQLNRSGRCYGPLDLI
jgi:hypothetical protein